MSVSETMSLFVIVTCVSIKYSVYFFFFLMRVLLLLFLLVMLLSAAATLDITHYRNCLPLKAPITTAADDIHKYFFIVFRENKT